MEPARLTRMADAVPFRAPDGVGAWVSGPIGLLHLRSVTTPEDTGQPTPLRDDVRGWTLTWDGRLDNREDLRRELPDALRPAPDAADARFVLAAFESWGEECVDRLVGDFVFALWQDRERRLFCARSLTGFRVLVWWSDGRTFLFGPEVSALLADGAVPRRVNEGFVAELLTGGEVSHRETLWDGLFHLPRGGALVVDGGGRREWRWHRGPFDEIRYKDDRDYEAHFRALFEQAVTACMRSAGPVAADLSGGLDSSAIVCLGTQLCRRDPSRGPLLPFSMIYPGEPQDELEWIDLVAAQTGVAPTYVQPPPYDWDYWRAWSADSLDLPMRPNGAGRLTMLHAIRARGARFSLSGEGGDDWFRGSPSHWPDLLRAGRLPEAWRQACRSETRPLSPVRTARRLVGNGLLPLLSRRHRDRRVYGPGHGQVPDWLAPDWARALRLRERLHPIAEEPALSGLGARWLYLSNLCLPYVPMRLAERLGALCDVEWRAPLHDRRLVEFALRLPGGQNFADGQKKALMRRALAGVLPEPIRLRQTKAEFSAPIREAIRRLGPAPELDRLCARGWVAREKLLSESTPLFALWNAVAVDTWLREAVD